MHEVGLMQTALEVALAHARRQGAVRIHRMTLRVGALSGVVPEALQLAFTAITHGTPAEGAALEVEEVPVVCRCRNCGAEFQPADLVFACPRCETISSEWHRGQDLELTSIEVS